MKLLIVGGAGHVGSIIRPALETRFDCTYFDIVPVPQAQERTTVADVNDDQQVQHALTDIDVVIYLPMGYGQDPLTGKPSVNELGAAFDVNVKALYRFLIHALGAKVKSFIYASTLSVYTNYFQYLPLTEEIPANTWTPYGFSKRVGEFICQAAAQQYPQATIIALRLIMPSNAENWQARRYNPDAANNICGIGPTDLQRLFVAAAKHQQPGYYCLQATGDMREDRFSNQKARDILGWSPRNE